MKYAVQWDQWYRCGRYGDDKDYEVQERTFNSRFEAEEYIDRLVAGEFKGLGDCTVHRHEVQIILKCEFPPIHG